MAAIIVAFLGILIGMWGGFTSGRESMFRELCEKNGDKVLERNTCIAPPVIKFEVK